MKRLFLLVSIAVTLFLYSCGSRDSSYPQERNNVSITPMSNNVNIQADKENASFDVNKLGEIVQKCTDPKLLEEKINDPDNNINNLDLDKDGKIDYLSVTEPSENKIVISDASVDPAVTVATLSITPNQQAKTASMQIQGEPAYCGSYNTYYRPSITFGEMLFLTYLLAPHAYYRPMYGYGHYPSYYSSRRTVVRTVYRPSTSQYVRQSNSAARSSTTGSGSNRSNLSQPSRSQRSFGQRDNARPAGSGGFGNGSRSAPPSRSMPSSGGSRRSFGGRRR